MFQKITRLCLVMVAVGLLLLPPLLNAEVRSRQEPGISFYGLSTDTKPTSAHQGRTTVIGDKFFEIDTGIESVFDGTVFAVSGAASIQAIANSVTLTAPQTTVAMSVIGYNTAGYFFTVGSISTSVTTILWGKAGASTWTAIEADSTVYTTDGAKAIYTKDAALLDSVKFEWESEIGAGAELSKVYQSKARE